jgi:hypothetical protein
MRGNYANRWYVPRPPFESPEALRENRVIIQQFLSTLRLVPDEGDPRRLESHKHMVDPDVPLSAAFENLLTMVRINRPSDSTQFFGVLMQVKNYLEQRPDSTCTVFQMRPGVTEPSVRRVNQDDDIDNIFQGGYPVPGREIYPGDNNIIAQHRLTIQIHHLDEVRRYASENRRYEIIATDVPVIAVWVPREMSADWLSQDHGGPA